MGIIERARNSKIIAVVIVSSLIFIDFTLLTAIVPVVPPFLWKLHLRNMQSKPSQNISYHLTTKTHHLLAQSSNNVTTTTITSRPSLKAEENAYLATQSIQIAAIFAAKPIVQFLGNFFVGALIDRIGSGVPMFVGVIVICATATAFALGQSYPVLLCSAAIQGLGSGCIMAGGMAMLAKKFTDSVERGRAIGVTLAITGLGTVVGPPYGSAMYSFVGKTATFLVLAGIIAVVGIFQVCYSSLKIEKIPKENTTASMWALLKDPYIILAASSIMTVDVVVGSLNAGFPTWLLRKLNTPKYLLGVAFIPLCISYILTTNLIFLLPVKNLHWVYAMGGVFVTSIGCLTLPFTSSLPTTIGPMFVMGFGIGCLETNMFPILAILVDNRHRQAYGSVYAIADMSICLGLIIGPLITGAIVKALSFSWAVWIMSIVLFIFAPSLIFLKNPTKASEETANLLNNSESAKSN